MSKCIEILIILSILPMIAFANIGGAVQKPGIIGEPTIFIKTDISIEKEELFVNFYKEDSKVKCSFEAIYHLTREKEESTKITGVFYGLRAQNIEICNSNNLDIIIKIDSIKTAELDTLFFRTPIKNSLYPPNWFDLKPLSKTAFEYNYNSNIENIIKVKGILNLNYTEYWGLAAIGSIVQYKHPWLNKDVKPLDSQFQYLIEPISSWKSVGEIIVKVSYTKDLLIESYLLDNRNPEPYVKINNKINRFSDRNEYVINITDNFPEIIKFNIEEPKQVFCKGGPFLGIGANSSKGFISNVSWEFASNINYVTGIFYRLGFETNFKNYNLFSPAMKIETLMIPSLGINFGIPYDLKDKELFYRAGFSIDLLILGVEFNWDYHKKSEKWENTIMGTITF